MSDLLKEAIAEEMAAEIPPEFEQEQEAAEPMRLAIPDLSFLAAPTGDGSVEEYIQHPLNFDQKNSTARILRGATGICGSLDYALIDIGLGLIEKIQERKKENETPKFNYRTE